MIGNIIGLVIWTIVTIMSFCKPKEYDTPNWLMGIIGLGIMLECLVNILGK